MMKTWKRLKTKWIEVSLLIGALLFAGVITILRPFDGDTIGYFADISTPLMIVVAILIIIIGVRRR